MTHQTNYSLYVNLSASQTRKRLKGHGFGVKRVEAVDRHQAVIVHTATGDHLRDLQALFADVVSSESKNDLDIPVENLRNLGSTSALWLRDVGVRTRAELQQLGPVHAFRLVKQNHPGASLNLLYAMAAALEEVDVGELSEAETEKLRAEAEDD